jgi:hypothetical protein
MRRKTKGIRACRKAGISCMDELLEILKRGVKKKPEKGKNRLLAYF